MRQIALNSNMLNNVREVSQKIDNLVNPIANKFSLTSLQLKMILALGTKEEAMPIGELGRSVGVSGGNISNICKKLEKEGMLSRTRSKQDERVVFVDLTEQGKETYDGLMEYFHEHFKVLDSVTQDELDQIDEALATLNRILDSYMEIEDKVDEER